LYFPENGYTPQRMAVSARRPISKEATAGVRAPECPAVGTIRLAPDRGVAVLESRHFRQTPIPTVRRRTTRPHRLILDADDVGLVAVHIRQRRGDPAQTNRVTDQVIVLRGLTVCARLAGACASDPRWRP
jgi:hypothetical protein